MANDATLPLSELCVGDLIKDGIVLSVHPLWTTCGTIIVDNKLYKLNRNQQVLVYMDNMLGQSGNQVYKVVDANTLEGVREELLKRDPRLAQVQIKWYDRFAGASNRKPCSPIFTKDDDHVHLSLKPL
jgi:hypothetical protein